MVQSSHSSSSAAVAAMAGGAGLRSRKVDFRKALTVYRASDIPDMDETVSTMSRTGTQAARGVEKEEEEEHHLQVALNTNQTGVSAASVFIPTPDASKQISDYGVYYSKTFQPPKSLIKFSSTIDDCIGCPYNMDERDDAWLAEAKKGGLPRNVVLNEDVFEMIMWTLERLANEKLTGECPLLPEYQEFLAIEQPALLEASACFPSVYAWWKTRRFRDRKGQPITPQLKYEDIGVETDSYVCFRRREVKTARKTRRCDQQSLDKLRRLREEMESSHHILEMVSNREKLRKESLMLEMDIFEERIKVRRMKKLLGIVTTTLDADASPEKKRKIKKADGPTKIKIPLQKLRDAVGRSSDLHRDSPLLDALDIEERVKRKRWNDEKEGWLDFSEVSQTYEIDGKAPYRPRSSEDYWTTDLPISFTSPTLSYDPPMFRCRIGRGGRRVMDRHQRCAFNHNEELRQKWRFDTSDLEEEEEATELNENYRTLSYRAFHLAPLSEQECRTLMNKPSFPEQINVQPLSHQQRFQHIVLQQQKRQDILNKCQSASAASPSGPSASQKKRASRPSSSADTKGSSTSVTKKKAQEPLDPRAAAVNAMVQQARKQAQANQLLFSNSPRPSTDSGQPGATAGSTTSPPKNGTGGAKNASLVNPLGIPMNANMMNMMAAATPQQRMRLNQLRMQQNQAGLMNGVGFPQNMAGLTPQQFQRLYYGNQQQQLLMQQAALQNQMRMGMNAMMLNGGTNPAQAAQLQAQLQMMQQNQLQTLNKMAPSLESTETPTDPAAMESMLESMDGESDSVAPPPQTTA